MIKVRNIPDNAVRVEDVAVGKVFLYAACTYMKVRPVEAVSTINRGGRITKNCINLTTGEICFFRNPDTRVVVVPDGTELVVS